MPSGSKPRRKFGRGDKSDQQHGSADAAQLRTGQSVQAMADPGARRAGAAWRCQSGLLHSASFWLVISCPAGHPSGRALPHSWDRAGVITDPVLIDDWHPVVSCDALAARGSSAPLLGEDIVVWQADGRALAWQDLAVLQRHAALARPGRWLHAAMPLSRLGLWRRRAVRPHPGAARCAAPRKARVKTYRALERYGLVWVSLGDPAHDVPPFPEWHDAGFRKRCGSCMWPTRAAPGSSRTFSTSPTSRSSTRISGHARTARDRRL